MKLPGFTKEKVFLMLGVVVFMGVVWVVLQQVQKRAGIKSETLTNSSILPVAESSTSKHYQSIQLRKMPCGLYRKQIVELDGPTGVKSVQILDKDGVTVLREKKMPIDMEHCAAISHGTFVPELWKDCRLDV